MVAVALAAGLLVRPAAAQDGGSAALKAQFDEVLGQEAGLLDRLTAAQKARADVQRQLDQLDATVMQASIQLLGAQQRLDAAAAADHRARAVLAAADARVRRATERLHRQAVDSFINGGTSGGLVEALLHATDGDLATRTIAYADAVVHSTTSIVQELDQARAARDQLSRAARRATAEATRTRDDIEAARRFVTDSRDAKKRLADDLALQALVVAKALQDVQATKLQVEASITAENRASDAIALQIALAEHGQPPFTPGSVNIVDPIPGAPVTSEFGTRTLLGLTRLHPGIDLGRPTGTPIHAAADGVVLIAGPHGGYGNATVIDHGHSLATLYGHQSRIVVTVGQVVKQGDVIGYVGSTGYSTGPHLHFETRINGTPINPREIVTFF